MKYLNPFSVRDSKYDGSKVTISGQGKWFTFIHQIILLKNELLRTSSLFLSVEKPDPMQCVNCDPVSSGIDIAVSIEIKQSIHGKGSTHPINYSTSFRMTRIMPYFLHLVQNIVSFSSGNV